MQKQKFTIEIEQIRRGYVSIEAEDISGALEIANRRFNEEGEELPEMEDCVPLECRFVEAVCVCCLETFSAHKLTELEQGIVCKNCDTKIKKEAMV